MKKWSSILLAALLLVGIVSGCTSLPSPTEGDGSTEINGTQHNATVNAGDINTTAPNAPTDTDATEPTTSEPAVTEPAVSEPAVTEPAASEPAITEPAASEPAVTEPVITEPAITREWIKLQVWTPEEDQVDGGWLDIILAQFEEMHPEYRITWDIRICSESDAGYQVTSDVSAAADVFMFANDQMTSLIWNQALMELSGSAKRQVLEDNSKAAVDTVTYYDDGIYGFPMTNNTWYMYYDKSVFSEDDVKSLDTMLSKGKVSFPMTNAWYCGTFFMANGGTLFGDQGIDASAGIQFGGENGYSAAKKMVELAQHPNLRNSEGCNDMIRGKASACFSGSWDYQRLHSALGDDLGVAQLPAVEIDGKNVQMRSFCGSKCVGVNPSSRHPDAAMALAALMASPESQLLRFELSGIIPISKKLIDDPAVRSSELTLAEINTMAYCAIAQPKLPEMGNYWLPMENWGKAIVNGEVTLSNYREKVDQLVRDLNYSDF